MKNELKQGDKVSVKVGTEVYQCTVSTPHVFPDHCRVVTHTGAMVTVTKSSVELVR